MWDPDASSKAAGREGRAQPPPGQGPMGPRLRTRAPTSLQGVLRQLPWALGPWEGPWSTGADVSSCGIPLGQGEPHLLRNVHLFAQVITCTCTSQAEGSSGKGSAAA